MTSGKIGVVFIHSLDKNQSPLGSVIPKVVIPNVIIFGFGFPSTVTAKVFSPFLVV